MNENKTITRKIYCFFSHATQVRVKCFFFSHATQVRIKCFFSLIPPRPESNAFFPCHPCQSQLLFSLMPPMSVNCFFLALMPPMSKSIAFSLSCHPCQSQLLFYHATHVRVSCFFSHATQVKVNKTYHGNNLCGLCGNGNSDPTDDFRDRRGAIVDTADHFLRSWHVRGACQTAAPGPRSTELVAACRPGSSEAVRAESRCRGFFHRELSACASRVDVMPYVR